MMVVHIIRSHELYKAEYKYIRDMCQKDRPKGVTLAYQLNALQSITDIQPR